MPDVRPHPLPLRIEEIDRDWLTAALQTRAPAVQVRDVEIVDVIHGTCTKIRLRLDTGEEGRRAGIPESVILKGGFEEHSREMHFTHKYEVDGYRHVLPVLNLQRPDCYFAEYDPGRKQGIVIMEDLVARGVTFCDPLKPQSFEEVARRLILLAKFHSRTWNSPELASGGKWGWLGEMLTTARAHFNHYLQPEIWQRFVSLPRGAAASTQFHDLEWMDDALDRLVTLGARVPHSVVHGDTHLGNLYVDPDGTPGFFDPLPHRAPALLEVAYHVTGALDTADRPRWEGALVRNYLEELRRNGVEAPDFEEAMRHYGAFLGYGYLVFLVNDPVFQKEAVNTAYTARFSAAMLDHDTMGLLEGEKG